jgi:hypothetical protein
MKKITGIFYLYRKSQKIVIGLVPTQIGHGILITSKNKFQLF